MENMAFKNRLPYFMRSVLICFMSEEKEVCGLLLGVDVYFFARICFEVVN